MLTQTGVVPVEVVLAIVATAVTMAAGMIGGLWRALLKGALRTDREFQEKVEENKWLRADNVELRRRLDTVTNEHATTANRILGEIRDMAKQRSQ
jgi:regulator of replication initiation timing